MSQKGFSKLVIVILAIVIVGGIVGYFIVVQKPEFIPTIPTPPLTEPTPPLIKNIEIDLETGSQKPENDFQIMEQIKEKVKQGELLWFKNPVEVSKKYSDKFGISTNAQYKLETQSTEIGEYSGLFHADVLVTDGQKSYRIALVSEPADGKPSIWAINAVIDIQQENKLRVSFFQTASNTKGVSHQDIVKRFSDGTTIYFLDVANPLITFYLNRPANPSTVNVNSVIIRVDDTELKGANVRYVVEQGVSHGQTFPMFTIHVDLSNVSALKDFVGRNIKIILTDKIKDQTGLSLQQCNHSYNKGECIEDASGQKIKVFGIEVKLYSLD